MSAELSSPIEPQKTQKNNVVAAVIIITGLTTVVVGGFCLWSRSTRNAEIASLQQQLTEIQQTLSSSKDTLVSPSPSESPPGQVMKSYTSVNSLYQLQLPAAWVGITPIDGSFMSFTRLDDGTTVYGPKDKSRTVLIESFTPATVAPEFSTKLYDVVLDIRIDPSDYPLTSQRTEGEGTIYEHTAKAGVQGEIQHYIVFAKPNILVLLGFSTRDQITQDIISSFKFLP